MNVCSHNLLQPNEQGRTSVYICHIQISFSRLDWLWKNCLQSNFTFVLRSLGVARILYRREWHPTSYSAFMWRCRRLPRRCVHNLPSGFNSFVSSRYRFHRRLGLHRFLFYDAGKRCTVVNCFLVAAVVKLLLLLLLLFSV